MAKVASKWHKPAGLTVIPSYAIKDFLKELPVGKIWGIGSRTTVYLRKLGVTTALELADKRPRQWIAEHCDRPLAEIYEEFQGNYIKKLEIGAGKSVGFGGLHIDGSADSGADFSANSPRMPARSNIRGRSTRRRATAAVPVRRRSRSTSKAACAKLRAKGWWASRASFFLEDQRI